MNWQPLTQCMFFFEGRRAMGGREHARAAEIRETVPIVSATGHA